MKCMHGAASSSNPVGAELHMDSFRHGIGVSHGLVFPFFGCSSVGGTFVLVVMTWLEPVSPQLVPPEAAQPSTDGGHWWLVEGSAFVCRCCIVNGIAMAFAAFAHVGALCRFFVGLQVQSSQVPVHYVASGGTCVVKQSVLPTTCAGTPVNGGQDPPDLQQGKAGCLPESSWCR